MVFWILNLFLKALKLWTENIHGSSTHFLTLLEWICHGAQPGSMRIWAFLFGLFWESVVVYYVLWKSYKRMLDLRDIIVTNSRARPQQYTVLVRDIPKLDGHETRTDQVSSFFRRVHPGYYGGCLILNNLRPVSASLSIPLLSIHTYLEDSTRS